MTKLPAGPCWRVASSGTVQCYLIKYKAEDRIAVVAGQGQRQRWALQPMEVAPGDLFADRQEARAEYRRRKETTP